MINNMPDDDVDKFLAEQKNLEGKRHELIKELLRQKDGANRIGEQIENIDLNLT